MLINACAYSINSYPKMSCNSKFISYSLMRKYEKIIEPIMMGNKLVIIFSYSGGTIMYFYVKLRKVT